MAAKITAGKKQAFEEELRYLKNEGRQDAVKKIQEARAFGDLSENYEYKIAREEQGKLETRIVEIESILASCEVYEPAKGSKVVALGSVVTVEDIDTEKRSVFEIVGVYESDPNTTPKKISDESPIGKVLMGHEKDDEVDFVHKGRTVTYCIVDIK